RTPAARLPRRRRRRHAALARRRTRHRHHRLRRRQARQGPPPARLGPGGLGGARRRRTAVAADPGRPPRPRRGPPRPPPAPPPPPASRPAAQLHSLAAPSLVPDAADLWQGRAPGFGPRARIEATLAVRRAARAWPRLEHLLDSAVPDELALSDDDLEQLL